MKDASLDIWCRGRGSNREHKRHRISQLARYVTTKFDGVY